MNFGETLAYWYLCLKGFISNASPKKVMSYCRFGFAARWSE
ncbi:MAG: hypothetical protein ACR2HX_23740 [Pyrinomonadaceae bacterium]